MLDWLNRALAVLVLVLILVGALGLALVPSALAAWLRAAAGAIEQPAFSTGWLALLAGALLAGLVALVLLVLELRVRRGGTVALAGDGSARLATETLVQRLRTDVEAIAEVDQARPVIQPRRKTVDVDLLVTTAPSVDVPSKAAQIGEVARATIESLGLKPGKVSVQLSHTTRGWPGQRGSDQGAAGGAPAAGA